MIVDVFADDGLTGTDTARPNFKRLEGCIVRKEVNCMIINPLHAVSATLRPAKFWRSSYPYGARFIAQARHLLTLTQTPILQAALKYLLGECSTSSLRDHFRRIRKTFKMKRERGEFIGAFAPYGYKKVPKRQKQLDCR